MKLNLPAVFLLFLSALYAQDFKTPVFVSGTEGYKTFRIPAIVKTPGGALLAFCEGRVNNAGDYGDIDIVMKKSLDGGRTWSGLIKVVDNNNRQAGNCTPVFDHTDPRYRKGRLFLFYNASDRSEMDIRNGKGVREVFYITSADEGKSWSPPVNITSQVHRPNEPEINPEYNFEEDWRWYANAPGHALQIEWGKYKGRIVVPANHSAGAPLPKGKDYYAHAFYTDDNGRTFHLSGTVNYPSSNESTAAMLRGNSVIMNSRIQSGEPKLRLVSLSSNGGETWYKSYPDINLPSTVCQGSIINAGKMKGKNILAFSSPADTLRRNNLTIKLSFDEGKSWSKSILIDGDNSAKDYTAYSDLVKVNDREVGILYERNNYSEIIFSIVRWK